MKNPHAKLATLLRDNPSIAVAYLDDLDNPKTLTIHDCSLPRFRNLTLGNKLHELEVRILETNPLHILRCPVTLHESQNVNQECQDEPIYLGTQIQPSSANWVGTAGAPVKWLDSARVPHWGILSNWHVLADGDPRVGRTCHQPTTARRSIGTLAEWSGPDPAGESLIDAALADALVDGRHTIDNEIIGLGDIGPTPIDARVGLAVAKSGRTTGVTYAECTAVGASVRVGYGDFTAILADQDIFESSSGTFSAAGDSGSIIVEPVDNRPCSLLFAGGGNLTIGNAIRHVIAAFNLVFPFN